MANQSGQIYGLTVLSPILQGASLDIDHAMDLRWFLAGQPRNHTSAFAQIANTHFARLVVMDDVVFVGSPAIEEHLKSRYLIFESSFYGDLDTYLTGMAMTIPKFVDDVWKHCVGYPGVSDPAAFAAYIKKCQVETTFFFADVNNQTPDETLTALQAQSDVAHFVAKNQGKPAAEIQKLFGVMLGQLAKAPTPPRGGIDSEKTAAEDRPYDR